MVDIMNEISFIDPKLLVIIINSKLSSEYLKLVSMLLLSNKTRFRISSIRLKFDLLSECLVMLSLWKDCSMLKSIYFSYSKSEEEKETEVINLALKQFKQSFGAIERLKIIKSDN